MKASGLRRSTDGLRAVGWAGRTPQNGGQANDNSYNPVISGNGRYVAFTSSATNLVAFDTNNYDDIFIRDRATGTTERVSLAQSGAQGNGASAYTAVSGEGRFVAFRSDATNLVDGDTNGFTDIFVRDRGTISDVQLAVGDAQVSEGSATLPGTLSFAVGLSGRTSTQNVTFRYSTEDNSARGGSRLRESFWNRD